MLTLPVAQLLNRQASVLEMGGSRLVGTRRYQNLFLQVSNGSLADMCVVGSTLP